MSIDTLQAHYGFTRMPFSRDIPPQALHPHPSHREAMAGLIGASANANSASPVARSAPGKQSPSGLLSLSSNRLGIRSFTFPTRRSRCAESIPASSPRSAGARCFSPACTPHKPRRSSLGNSTNAPACPSSLSMKPTSSPTPPSA